MDLVLSFTKKCHIIWADRCEQYVLGALDVRGNSSENATLKYVSVKKTLQGGIIKRSVCPCVMGSEEQRDIIIFELF